MSCAGTNTVNRQLTTGSENNRRFPPAAIVASSTGNAFVATELASLRAPLLESEQLDLAIDVNSYENDTKSTLFIPDDALSDVVFSFLSPNEASLLSHTTKQFNRMIQQHLHTIGITPGHKGLYKEISKFLSTFNGGYTREQIESIRSIILNPKEFTSFFTTPTENYGLGLTEREALSRMNSLKLEDKNILTKLTRPLRTRSAASCCLLTNSYILIAWAITIFLVGPILLATGNMPRTGDRKTDELLLYGIIFGVPIVSIMSVCVGNLLSKLQDEERTNRRILSPEQAMLLSNRPENEIKNLRVLFHFCNAILDYVAVPVD